MSVYFEIAYAAAAGRLVLFTGTGFSMAITQGQAPSWGQLMKDLCTPLKQDKALKRELFPKDNQQQLSYEEIAQILELQYQREGLDFYQKIADMIGKLELKGDNAIISKFLSQIKFQAVTTNYDKLLQALLPEDACQTVCPGLPIPRSEAKATVYHIHGSIDLPKKMVVTSNDYFDFINTPFYFSKKLDTLLHESTVLIMGYSLGDANLKPILNSYKNIAQSQTSGGNLFFVSRSPIGKHLKDYYAHSYGIRVIDKREIHDLFKRLQKAYPAAKDCYDTHKTQIKDVLSQKTDFDDQYLRMENAIYEINAGLSALGYSRQDPAVVNMMATVIKAKVQLTKEDNAWDQYTHLAKWLVYLGNSMAMHDAAIASHFMDAVEHSLKTCSERFRHGFSYKAYQIWNDGWSNIMPTNREQISNHLFKKLEGTDAAHIVSAN